MKYIFDIDGTLIDSSFRHKIVLRDVLYNAGISIEDADLDAYFKQKLLGMKTKDYLTQIFQLPEIDAKKIVDEWVKRIEMDKYLEFDRLYEDTIPALSTLSPQSIVYLTARKNKPGLLKELERLGISRYASSVYVVCPECALEEKDQIVRQLISESECMIIGDTEIEYDIATKYAIPSLILNRGFRSQEYWTKKNVTTYSSLIEGMSLKSLTSSS